MPEVLNRRTDRITNNTIYVGRPTTWGNPFKHPDDGTRNEVVKKYRAYISKKFSIASIRDVLAGKDLACWRAPLTCHADILLELANSENNK